MDRLYRFSPIASEDECQRALEYIQIKLRELSRLVLEEQIPVYTLKIFAHYEGEYEYLLQWANEMGKRDDASSATSYYVKPFEVLKVNDEVVSYLGIRIPDPYRAQVGCGDFIVKNLEDFKKKYIGKKYIREIEHPVYKMLELYHPDFDVLGYVVEE